MNELPEPELQSVLDEYITRPLTTAQRRAIKHLAAGRIAAKDAAAVDGLSYETVRARRNRLYRQLGVHGANDLLSGLLRVTLRRLQACSEERPCAI